MKLSVVATLYQSAPHLREFYDRISEIANRITSDYEIILVNDGSPDNSLDIALGIFAQDARTQIVDLSRNFGHHKAMMTGLSHARGEFVFLIDSDLEEPPEILEVFWKEIQSSEDTDVVYGQQKSRRGNWIERISGSLFYKMFNWFSYIKIPENILTARLMKRDYVDALIKFREQELFLAGVWASAGFSQKAVLIEKISNSRTTYTLSKKLAVLINSITSFTNRPLIYIFYLGSVISALSSVYIVYLVYRKLALGFLAGWTSIIASIWLVGGMIIFSIGLLGIYLSKIFSEVKDRPYTIVKRHYFRNNSHE
ncbi:MAG: glycosyl transferase [Thermodesulfovibrio sp.]|nr:glycosyl transferase [Thermodesulfovibrio sp.]